MVLREKAADAAEPDGDAPNAGKRPIDGLCEDHGPAIGLRKALEGVGQRSITNYAHIRLADDSRTISCRLELLLAQTPGSRPPAELAAGLDVRVARSGG